MLIIVRKTNRYMKSCVFSAVAEGVAMHTKGFDLACTTINESVALVDELHLT